jgi:DNA-directed RNA polymerase subunit beta'
LGIYYLSQSTESNDKAKPKGYFSNVSEIEQALETKSISIHTIIICRFETIDDKGNKISEKHRSTAGRFILANILPKHHKIKFSLIDKILSKKNVSEIIDIVYRYCGQKETVNDIDNF